jgi:hypothetical protein
MTIDPETGETSTTTTRVDDVTGEVHQTTVTRRPGAPGPLTWGLGVLAVVAIVALVYMFVSSNNRSAADQARLDAQNAATAMSAAAAPAGQITPSPYPDPALQAQVSAAQTQAAVAEAQTQAATAAAAQASNDRSAAASEHAAAAADRAAAERARSDAAAQSQTPPPVNGETPQV